MKKSLTSNYYWSMILFLSFNLLAVDKALLQKWQQEDVKAGRLFRYAVFFDVMGMNEDFFQKNIWSRGLKKINWSKITTILRPRAVDEKKSPFKLYTIAQLSRKNLVKGGNTGSIKILDGYVIWNEGKTVPKKLSTLEQKYWNDWKNIFVPSTELGLMGALKYTDVRYLQALDYVAGPVAFQLASTMTCIEGDVNELVSMLKHPVQGENAVLGTMGGGIIRRYRVPLKDRLLLGAVDHNKITINAQTGKFNIVQDLDDNDIQDIAIGLHQDVVVTSGYSDPFVRLNDPNYDVEDIGGSAISYPALDKKDIAAIKLNDDAIPRNRIEFLFKEGTTGDDRNPVFVFNGLIPHDKKVVDQILTAAPDLRFLYKDRIGGGKDKSSLKVQATVAKSMQKNARIILKAMYEGTFLAAAMRGCTIVYITLVGAGAFYNEIEWIMEAIDQQSIKNIIKNSGMEVVLVLYPDIRAGRGLDGKNFNELKDGQVQVGQLGDAIPKIYQRIDAMNDELQPSRKKEDALEDLAYSLHSLK